jgi:hypothetical protein
VADRRGRGPGRRGRRRPCDDALGRRPMGRRRGAPRHGPDRRDGGRGRGPEARRAQWVPCERGCRPCGHRWPLAIPGGSGEGSALSCFHPTKRALGASGSQRGYGWAASTVHGRTSDSSIAAPLRETAPSLTLGLEQIPQAQSTVNVEMASWATPGRTPPRAGRRRWGFPAGEPEVPGCPDARSGPSRADVSGDDIVSALCPVPASSGHAVCRAAGSVSRCARSPSWACRRASAPTHRARSRRQPRCDAPVSSMP